MYRIERISKEPATCMRVQISLPSEGEAGLAHGGTFWFQPAGDPNGDDAVGGLNEAQARAIMDDASLAVHFTCTPALAQQEPVVDAAPAVAVEPDADAAQVTRGDGGDASKKKKGSQA